VPAIAPVSGAALSRRSIERDDQNARCTSRPSACGARELNGARDFVAHERGYVTIGRPRRLPRGSRYGYLLSAYLRVNTVKRRTHSLFPQGSYWDACLPTMRDEWLARLMAAFDKIVREHAVFRALSASCETRDASGPGRKRPRPGQDWTSESHRVTVLSA
jgi:hypothetical protein